MALENEQFMAFTTFRRDGRTVTTPVWLVHLTGGEIGFSTGADSGKVKRLGNDARVAVQACDRRGASTHGPVYEGVARVSSDTELTQIRTAIKAKYGAMANVLAVAGTVARRFGSQRANAGRVGVIVTLNPADLTA